MLNAGELNRFVRLGTSLASRDAAGGPVSTASIKPDTYAASIRPLTGREYERLGLTVGEVTHAMVLRYCAATAALKPKDSIHLDGRRFEIVSIVDRQEAHRAMDLMVKEIVA